MTEHQRQVVATGISYGALPNDDHARKAVEQALSRMQDAPIGSVLLFLTTGYANGPGNAIKQAAKAAGTPQIFGCCAASILSEQEWVLDAEGAVAMVFPQSHRLQSSKIIASQGQTASQYLTIASPNAAIMAVNAQEAMQFGSICSDDYGHGPYSIWQSGRIEENEYVHLSFPSELEHCTKVAAGITHLSPIMQINLAEGHALLEINEEPAVDNLLDNLPGNLHAVGLKQPYNILCAVSENNSLDSIKQGHYKLHHIVSTDAASNKIHLSGSVKAGRHMFWALRDEQQAQATMLEKLQRARLEFGEDPAFALMFPNLGRGPEFYNGRDRDFDAFKKVFADTPLIGFYGNGEIAPGHSLAGLIHHYSTVFALYR